MTNANIEILNITNTGFQIANENTNSNPTYGRLTYGTAGFITTPTMRRLGL